MRLGLLLAAMVLTAGCSGGGSDDDPGSSGTTPGRPDEPEVDMPILFSANQQEETEITRALVPLETKVASFIVWGYKNFSSNSSQVQIVFPGYNVVFNDKENSTTTNTDGWEYVNLSGYEEQTIKYWDWSAYSYRFFGYIGNEKTDGGSLEIGEFVLGEETSAGVTYKTISFKADATTDEYVEKWPYISTLWYSTGILSEYPDRQFGKPVQLLFLKPYARVRFMFTLSNPDAVLLLDDKEFAPVDNTKKILTSCDLKVKYPLTGNETKEEYVQTNKVQISAFTQDYSDSYDRWYNVIAPQSLGTFKLSVRVNGASERKTVDVPAEYMSWLPGYQYTYVFKITEGGSVELDMVQSAYADWNPVAGGSPEVYNW